MLVAPSILSLKYDDFSNQIKALNESTDWIHFDVMDGNFVPNISFGPKIFETFRKNSNKFLDVHLMVTNPNFFAEKFAKAGADSITFHYESYNNLESCCKLIDSIHSVYIKAGISIKPQTDVEAIFPILNRVDMVLIMSVEPGFGGQEFIESSYEKIKKLDDFRRKNNLNFLIQVDGGINDRNVFELQKLGVDVVVAGSFVFDGDIKKNIESLKLEKKS